VLVYRWRVITEVLRTIGLNERGKNRQFWKRLKISGIESINSPDAIGLHGCDDLQIEYVATGYGVTAKQAEPPFHLYAGTGST
jgi:hypothetical protein